MISSPSMSVWSAAAVSRFFSWYSNSEIWKCFHEAEKSWTWNYSPFCFFPKKNNKTQEPTTTTTLHKNKASYPSPPVTLSPQKTCTCRLSSTVKAIPSCFPLSSDLTDNLGFHQPHHMSCSSKQSYKLTPPPAENMQTPIFCISLFFLRRTPAVLQLMELHLPMDKSNIWSQNGITALPWYRDEGSLTFSLSLKVDSQFVHSCSIHCCLDPQFIHLLLKGQSVVVKHTQQSVRFLLPVHLRDRLKHSLFHLSRQFNLQHTRNALTVSVKLSVVTHNALMSILLPVYLCDRLLSIRCSTCLVSLTCITHVMH